MTITVLVTIVAPVAAVVCAVLAVAEYVHRIRRRPQSSLRFYGC